MANYNPSQPKSQLFNNKIQKHQIKSKLANKEINMKWGSTSNLA